MPLKSGRRARHDAGKQGDPDVTHLQIATKQMVKCKTVRNSIHIAITHCLFHSINVLDEEIPDDYLSGELSQSHYLYIHYLMPQFIVILNIDYQRCRDHIQPLYQGASSAWHESCPGY